MEENQNEMYRYGSEKILLEDYVKMPTEKRIDFLKTLSWDEKSQLLANLFVFNLNANVQHLDELDTAVKNKAKKRPTAK